MWTNLTSGKCTRVADIDIQEHRQGKVQKQPYSAAEPQPTHSMRFAQQNHGGSSEERILSSVPAFL